MRHILPLLLLLTPVFAQPPTPPTPPVDAVKSYLALTDAQITQLQTIARQQGETLRQRQQEIGQKQQQLDTQLRNGSTDAAALGRLLLEIDGLRQQLETARKSFSDQAVAVLNQTQKDKLKILSDASKLQTAIQQAIGLNLVLPAAPQPGIGPMRFRPGLLPMMGGPREEFRDR